MYTKKRRQIKKHLVKHKRKTDKRRHNGRKMTKNNNKHVKKHRTKRNKKYSGGGTWIDSNTLPYDEDCAICYKNFSDTPELAVYKTDCGHVFHNNCLNNSCIAAETAGRDLNCPICRADLQTEKSHQCTDIWAFANKLLHKKSEERLDPKNRAIYDAQPGDDE